MKIRLKSYIDIVLDALKHRKLLLYSAYVLKKVGLEIKPYYLTQESAQPNLKVKLSSDFGSATCDFLTLPEIKMIQSHPETREFPEMGVKDGSCLCYAIKYHQEIMSFIWCNLTRCDYLKSSFTLKNDETYLFNAYTYKIYRGANLAPYLRNECYKSLSKLGRTRLFSHTEYFNAPAVNFKKKVNAKHIKLSLYINLLRKFAWHITLKQYPVK